MVTVNEPIPLAELLEVNEPSLTVIAFVEMVWSVLASVAVQVIPLFVQVLVKYDEALAVGMVSKVSLAQFVPVGGLVVPPPPVPEPQIWLT